MSALIDVGSPEVWARHLLHARRLRAVVALAVLYFFVIDLLWGVAMTHVPIYLLNAYVIGDTTSRIRNYRALEESARRMEAEREVSTEGPPPPPSAPAPTPDTL